MKSKTKVVNTELFNYFIFYFNKSGVDYREDVLIEESSEFLSELLKNNYWIEYIKNPSYIN